LATIQCLSAAIAIGTTQYAQTKIVAHQITVLIVWWRVADLKLSSKSMGSSSQIDDGSELSATVKLSRRHGRTIGRVRRTVEVVNPDRGRRDPLTPAWGKPDRRTRSP